MEGNSRGGAVVITHISVKGLPVIPSCWKGGTGRSCRSPRRNGKPKPWRAVNCATLHWHHSCVGSLLVLGGLCCAGAALCLSWSVGWEQEQQGVFDIGSVQVIKPKPQSRALSLKALGLSLCWWPLPGLELL